MRGSPRLSALAVLLGALLGALPARSREPTLRIALGEPRPAVELEADVTMELRVGDDLWIHAPDRGPLRLRAAGANGGSEEPEPLFRIMVRSSRDEAEVRRLAGWLREALPAVPVSVQFQREREAWRVYVGAFRGREDAAGLAPRLRRHGIDSLWITDRTHEEGPREAPPDTGVAVAGHGVVGEVRAAPLQGGEVRVDGAAYRGEIVIRPGPRGTLRIVNVVGMEDYLRGVVPREMGPAQFPRIEALRAQAVAARTYALRHRGQFEHLGYDLCDGPRCQAYGGVGSEHPLSDRAVKTTRGQVATHDGEPIRAFYTATCGGHTEGAEEVFPEEREDYLVGVPCPPEEPEGMILRGAGPVENLCDARGEPLSLHLALLVAAGLAPEAVLDPAWAHRRPGADWRSATAALQRRMTARGVDPSSLDAGSRPWAGRGELLAEASRKLAAAGDLGLLEGRVLATGRRGRIRVDTVQGSVRLELTGARRLFVRRGERAEAEGAVRLRPGDRIWWPGGSEAPSLVVVEKAAGRRDLFPPDRRWVEVESRAELERRVRSRTGGSGIVSLRALRATPSGRLTGLAVETSFGDLVLEGIRVRWGLGLRENLFTWRARERGEARLGETIEFVGYGWGHGVGLCQVGAYGLARSGEDHEEILRHYYPGVELRTLW